jgi:hypothetical protein
MLDTVTDRGSADVIYVLLLVQAAAGLLASVGEALLMATPLYLVMPLAKAVALLVIAGRIVRGRRWAIVAAIVLEWLALLGVWLGTLVGLLPGLAPSMTLTGLLTQVALPIAVIVLTARLLATRPPAPSSHPPASWSPEPAPVPHQPAPWSSRPAPGLHPPAPWPSAPSPGERDARQAPAPAAGRVWR